MLDDILGMEKDLLATLTTIKELIEEHDVFVMKGMIEPLNIHIRRAAHTLNELQLIKEDSSNEG